MHVFSTSFFMSNESEEGHKLLKSTKKILYCIKRKELHGIVLSSFFFLYMSDVEKKSVK